MKAYVMGRKENVCIGSEERERNVISGDKKKRGFRIERQARVKGETEVGRGGTIYQKRTDEGRTDDNQEGCHT